MKLINMKNNIFNIARYDKEEFLYMYNKTIDRLAEYSVEELEEREDLFIFKEGIGSSDYIAFNVIKIMNLIMKLQRPHNKTHEREVYKQARERV